jgi:hypothetical protein
MCKFYSAIVTREGKLFHNKWLTSHEDIILLNNLNEGVKGDNFVRVEFYPDNNDLSDIESYNLHVDGKSFKWFDKFEDDIFKQLKEIVKSMIIVGVKIPFLVGECAILKNCEIKKISYCRIYQMRESSKVGVMRESSNVGEMYESSNVGVMRGSSKVGEMHGSSKVINNNR